MSKVYTITHSLSHLSIRMKRKKRIRKLEFVAENVDLKIFTFKENKRPKLMD